MSAKDKTPENQESREQATARQDGELLEKQEDAARDEAVSLKKTGPATRDESSSDAPKQACHPEEDASREEPDAETEADQYSETEENDATETAPEFEREVEEDEEAASEEEARAGRLDACFMGLAKIGPLALLFALACMAWPIFWNPAANVYCPGEIKSVTAFLHALSASSWLAPTGLENGAFTAAQWPAFAWALGLMALSPDLLASGYLLPATTFLCSFFALMGVWCLAYAAGFGFRAAFAAGLILLCAPLFAPLPNFVGPAALAAGLFLFALVFFCRGWKRDVAWISLPVAFALTALAGLAGGLLHFIVPLLASFCFLVWRGNFRRAQRADAIFGFILMLVIIGCWLGAIMLYHDDAYFDRIFSSAWQWNISMPFKCFLAIAAGVLGVLPWILTIFGVSWFSVLRNAGRSLSASRHENGSALVWIALVLAMFASVFIPWFHPSAVAIVCLLAILLGKAVLRLGGAGSRFFYFLASLCLVGSGIILLMLSFHVTQEFILGLLPALPVADLGSRLLSLSTLPIVGGILLVGGLIALIFAKSYSGAGPLIYGILLVIILCQVCRLRLVPELAAMPETPLLNLAAVENMTQKASGAPQMRIESAQPEPADTAQPDAAEPAAPAQPEKPAETEKAPRPDTATSSQDENRETTAPATSTAPPEAAPATENATPAETYAKPGATAPAEQPGTPAAAENPAQPEPAAAQQKDPAGAEKPTEAEPAEKSVTDNSQAGASPASPPDVAQTGEPPASPDNPAKPDAEAKPDQSNTAPE